MHIMWENRFIFHCHLLMVLLMPLLGIVMKMDIFLIFLKLLMVVLYVLHSILLEREPLFVNTRIEHILVLIVAEGHIIIYPVNLQH